MTDTAGKSRHRSLAWLGPTLLVLGLVGVGSSFLLPPELLQTTGWSEEDALRHQAASETLHGLSFSADESTETRAAFEAAKAEYAQIDRQLVEAAETPRRWRALLRWGGALACVAGGLAALASPS